MSNYIKKYNIGEIAIDLPYNSYIHELPLLSFSDFRNSVNLSLIFNHKLKLDGNNMFNVKEGYKLNIQKKIIVSNNIPVSLIESNGKYVQLYRNKNITIEGNEVYNNVYTFLDESKRVLRIISNGYEIENEDLSKEIYNLNGDLVTIYDKYQDVYLSYIYNNNNLLTEVRYNNKIVSFTYENNSLTKIQYGGTETNIINSNTNLTISHYTGVTFNSSVNGKDYVIEASAIEELEQVQYRKECTYSNDTIELTNKENNSIVDYITYRFPSLVTLTYQSYGQVEITNKNQVTHRILFSGDKPLYSYEVIGLNTNEDNQFCAGTYISEVNIYRTLNEGFNNSFKGKLKLSDGLEMVEDNLIDNKFESNVSSIGHSNIEGNFLLTGWIKLESLSNDSIIGVSNFIGGNVYEFYVPVYEPNKWYFFAYQFELEANSIFVNTLPGVELQDLRITFQATHIIDENKKTNVLFKEDILIDSTSYEINPFTKYDFIYETQTNYNGTIELTLSDLLRYTRKKIMDGECSELYYDDGKKVITNISNLKVKLKNNTELKDISNYNFGYRYNNNDSMYITTIQRYNSERSPLVIIKRKDDNYYSSQYIDNYFDVIQSRTDNLITYYTRDKGLITRERLGNLYNYKYTYNTSNNTISVEDEFRENNSNTNINITYYMDPVFGTIYKKQISDGLVIEDIYDDDKSAILEKKFGNSPSIIKHIYGYNQGNLVTLASSNLNYNFEYNEDQLVKVKKFNLLIEEQEHDDLITTVYYPNQNNPVYSKEYVYDKYNRLKSVTNEIENTYGIYYSFNSITGEPIYNKDANNAKLIMSEDKIKGLKTRYKYNYNTGLLEKKTITSSVNYANKISNETFEYDKANRIIQKEYEYDANSSFKVKDIIVYVKDEDDPSIDQRVESSTYYIRQVREVNTTNTYDDYNRLTKKICQFNDNSNVEKKYVINNNMIESETLKFNETSIHAISYQYDSLERITTITIGNKIISYEYDNHGRLIRENNQNLDKTIIYEYNDNGNIEAKRIYSYTVNEIPQTLLSTKTYTYDLIYKDRLITFNNTTIPYNMLGSLTEYNGYSLTWSKGKLIGVSKGNLILGSQSYQYTYNGYGQRISKTYSKLKGTSSLSTMYPGEVTGYTKKYNYDYYGRIINEIGTITYYSDGTYNQMIDYIYDMNTIVGIKYTHGNDSNTYFFERNILGDVIGIYDTQGNLKVKYIYDGYGNCTISSETTDQELAQINPIRYKGYYYDNETGWFWLSSRYYSPELCRFISPDDVEYLDPESVNGLNLYCYCLNNPISYCDPSGHIAISTLILCGLALVGMGLTIGGVASDNNTMTAIGLTMVAIPALISGGLAAFATTGTLATWVGAGTMVAGVGTGLFASAEYQEAFTGNNWIIDTTGMSEEWYNGLLLGTASLATLGTVASSFAYSFNINSIQKVGKVDDYFGIKFTQKAPSGNLRVKTLGLHPAHNGHPIHWQLNNINPLTGGIGKKIRWDLLLRRLIG